jgi:leader peptidase (prepilin peptidase) / N-methyltransferase
LNDAPVALLIGVAVIFGVVFGSFLTVVAHRVPRGESIVSPRSECPHCGAPIRAYDNIPVVSWLMLRGACRDCRGPISPRYPIIEASTGIAFGLVTLWLLSDASPLAGMAGGDFAPVAARSLVIGAHFWLAAASIALTAIDLRTHRLPDAIVLPGYVIAAIGLILPALITGNFLAATVTLAGAGILFVAYALMALAWPGGMGAGDVKLAGVLGAFLGFAGWGAVAVGAFSAFVLGGVVSLVLIVTRRASRKTGIPFGPWMLAGAWVGVGAGNSIATSYLSWFGLTEI